jgi:tRNA uridine 5-carboxymethylaminomethyl modification enzyme
LEQPLSHEYSLTDLLRRPSLEYDHLMAVEGIEAPTLDPTVAEQVEIQIKYDGYIARQRQEVERQKKYETKQLPLELDYSEVAGLSGEVSEKLSNVKPSTLGQAARISGVTPAAVSLLLVHLKKREKLAS